LLRTFETVPRETRAIFAMSFMFAKPFSPETRNEDHAYISESLYNFGL
jgi:hypothetical protein